LSKNKYFPFTRKKNVGRQFLSFKGRYTLDIFVHNIAIKRYCGKRHFSSKIFSPVCIENIFWDNSKYFEMSLQSFKEKNILLSKCLLIFLSQYCVQKCLVCISPYCDIFLSKYCLQKYCVSYGLNCSATYTLFI